MNFQQLRAIRETVRRNFNLTEAANALITSQSGLSKHIKDIEDELGVQIFVRRGRRLLGLTEPGKEVAAIVDRMLVDATNMKRLGANFSASDIGQLSIATTHTQARYVLPVVVTNFKKAFPKVQLVLHQAGPSEIATLVAAGNVDIGIATEALQDVAALATFPYHSWYHGVIVPPGHPLEAEKSLSLEKLARWPIITYSEGFTGRTKIDQTFAAAGIEPDIVMAALDADVIKTYVELGLGIGIVAAMAYHAERDTSLRLLKSAHLFCANTSRIAVKRGAYLRGYAYRFIELCAPALTEPVVRTGAVDEATVELAPEAAAAAALKPKAPRAYLS